MSATHDLSPAEYRDLAEFRRQIRSFLHFSEITAKEYGLEPQQHQVLLAVHGLPEGVKPTIGEIAARLFIQHHSAVELINRLEARGAIARKAGVADKREVWITLTAAGRASLRKLAIAHRNEAGSGRISTSAGKLIDADMLVYRFNGRFPSTRL